MAIECLHGERVRERCKCDIGPVFEGGHDGGGTLGGEALDESGGKAGGFLGFEFTGGGRFRGFASLLGCILWADKSAVDAQLSIVADEQHRARHGEHFSRKDIFAGRVDFFQPCLDGVHACGTLLRLLVGVVCLFERLQLCGEGSLFGGQFVRQRRRLGMAALILCTLFVSEGRTGFDPLPSFRDNRLGGTVELGFHHAVEQGGIGDEDSAVFVVEEVAAYRSTGFLVGFERDEFHAPVAGRNLIGGQGFADGLRGIPWAEVGKNAFLRRVVIVDGEGHDVFKGDVLGAIGGEDGGADTAKFQPLADDGFGDAEAGGHVGHR